MFTNDDLRKMKDECVSELENLGYKVLPILDIYFTNKLHISYAVCSPGPTCQRNLETRIVENPCVVIEFNEALSRLDETWRAQVKTVVMHECIHAIPHKDYPYQLETPHGKRYDLIKQHVEKAYGYTGIDDDTNHGFDDIIPKIQEQIKSEKKNK